MRRKVTWCVSLIRRGPYSEKVQQRSHWSQWSLASCCCNLTTFLEFVKRYWIKNDTTNIYALFSILSKPNYAKLCVFRKTSYGLAWGRPSPWIPCFTFTNLVKSFGEWQNPNRLLSSSFLSPINFWTNRKARTVTHSFALSRGITPASWWTRSAFLYRCRRTSFTVGPIWTNQTHCTDRTIGTNSVQTTFTH